MNVDSIELLTGVVINYAEDNQIVSIDIQRASKVVDFSSIEADEIPINQESKKREMFRDRLDL